MALLGSFRNFIGMMKSAATLGVNNSVVRLLIENKENPSEVSRIYATFFWIFLIFSVVLVIPILAFAVLLSEFLFSTPDYHFPIRFFSLALPLATLNVFWLAVYNGLEAFRKIVWIQVISTVVSVAITVAFVVRGDMMLGLVSLAVAEVGIVGVTYLFVRQNAQYFKFDPKKFISKKYWPVIRNFSAMALLSAIIVPLTAILIRREIIQTYDIETAGIWDGATRLSGFYMLIFNSGLSLYYMPRLSGLSSNREFRDELKTYFKLLLPLFAGLMGLVYLLRFWVVDIAFSPEFEPITQVIGWQLAGDLVRVMTLAFGFQIVVKTMMKEYVVAEFAYNLIYFWLSVSLLKTDAVSGVLQGYFYANLFSLTVMLIVFRKVIAGRP